MIAGARSRVLPLALPVALVAAAACSSSAPAAEEPAPKGPSSCARVADHLVSLLSDTARQAPAEELDRVRAGFNRHCQDDRWSADAQRCFLELTTKDEVDRCASVLTPAQRDALEQPPSEAQAR
jgi:hypothetical protein